MAEIHVEPRKKTANNSWIWIVLVLLVVAALVYYFISRNNAATTTTSPADTTGHIALPLPTSERTAFL